MNYGFVVSGELERGRLAGALAELVAVPVAAVDVAGEDDQDRNWAAPVSCTVAALGGDLPWQLDIYLSDAIANPPPEAVAVAWLAGRLGAVVGYAAVPAPPSAYWLVGPDGRRTRARIYEEENDAQDVPSYRIDAVEQPLAAFPGLRVAALPEVIRSYRMPTPVTDRLRAEWQPLLAGDDGAGGTAVTDPAAWHAITRLGAWESMVSRLTERWPPDGWYPAEYYREDLETRDELSEAADTLPEPARSRLRDALTEIDHRFREATVAGDGSSDRWWWHRVPDPLPWR